MKRHQQWSSHVQLGNVTSYEDKHVKFKIKRATSSPDLSDIVDLEQECFPLDEHISVKEPGTVWWLIRDEHKKPVAYCGVKYMKVDNAFYFHRAGVTPSARRKGLHKRMIRTRIAYVKKEKANGAMTYTSHTNITSANNLIKCGFILWSPEFWGYSSKPMIPEDEHCWLYFWKDTK